MSFLGMLGLLLCIEGSTAVTPVFVQMGKDVLLNVSQTVTLNEKTDFIWKCNNSRILKCTYDQKVVIFDQYKGRTEFNTQSYSLLLKNLQHNDNGDYVAVVSAATEQTVTEYKVTVEEPVSPVKLTVVSNSSDPCNITVTCSTVNSHITKTFTCDNQTCSYQGGGEATPTYDSINVTVQEGVIICNHSNHVSWTNDRLDTKTYCGSQKESAAGLSFCLLKTVVVSVGLIIMVSAVTSVHLMETFKKNKPNTNKEATNGEKLKKNSQSQ